MSDIENAKQLLALAEEEVAALDLMTGSEKVSTWIFGFHAQQAVEKALKAWLSIAELEYPLTHSLNVLFGLLESKVGPEITEYRDLEMLTPFAVQFRYEAYEEDEAEINRPEIIHKVGALIEYVRRSADPAQE